MSGPLAGRRELITRPSEQAHALERLVREAGGEPVCVPAIEILPLADPAPFHALAARLAEFDLAIIVSRNAVRRALGLIGAKPWPDALNVAAVGQGSREELQQRGFASVIAPTAQSDSEALLALPALAAVRDRRIVIFRGEGGRELLGQELAARGASVEHAVCYRLVAPEGSSMRSAWARGMDAVTVSSAEGLANLIAMLGEGAVRQLSQIPLFVPHQRVAGETQRRGLQRAIVAGPGDAEMAAALVAHFGAAR